MRIEWGNGISDERTEPGGDVETVCYHLAERYIVEFPRPYHSTPGQHVLEVTIDKMDAFIRPAGLSVPIADLGLAGRSIDAR